MIVGKAVKMAAMMQIPILGLIENYSFSNAQTMVKNIIFLVPVTCKPPLMLMDLKFWLNFP